MRPAVATVLTAGTWEPRLVEFARQSATMRIVKRCRTAADVESVLDRIDGVVIGAETPWLSSPLLRRWRTQGVVVLGIATRHDRPARRMFEQASVDGVVTASEDPGKIFGAITSARVFGSRGPEHGGIVTVTGARGAPGCSEVALALAWAAGSRLDTVLMELDGDAPGLGLRLGLGPHAAPGPHMPRAVGPIRLITLPPQGGPMGRSVATRLVEMARDEFDAVVVDAGPPAADRIGFDAGRWILVVEPTPAGIVRAGRLVSGWTWATPIVVANMVPNGPDHQAAIKLIRAATGLEPAVAIPPLDLDTTVAHPAMVSMLVPLARSMFGSVQRSAAR